MKKNSIFRNPVLALTLLLGMVNIFASSGPEGSKTPFIIVCSVMGGVILVGVVAVLWNKTKG